ncbi:hypothetical protein [uncultured Xylophilus sp.]|uniref:hypothetical protein n=1 Tax=uncultured Xylophilus sp. TaxID=296832 RepID=UPI0025D3119E|nr:hypothetical protein [uncultured Xylophilus sp.]
MPPRPLIGLLAGAAGYALLSHWLMVRHAEAPWAAAVLLGPLLLAAAGFLPSRCGAAGWLLLALLAAGIAALVLRGGAGGVQGLYLLQHVGTHVLLGGWFASTLRAGRQSLIGSFAARVHGTLTPSMAAYTRRLTVVWSVYFFAMAAVSVAVYLLLPFDLWSVLGNVLTPVLIGALFLGEHLLRYRLHPEFERVSIADAVRAVRAVSAAGPQERRP